jgi:hypothetical protein
VSARVYLLIEEGEGGCCYSVDTNVVKGVFSSPESAKAQVAENKTWGWKQDEAGWYHGLLRCKRRANAQVGYRIDEWEVKG